jgi:hypothetical protein
MSTSFTKTKVSLQLPTDLEAIEAEAIARLKFVRVLQSWASDRLLEKEPNHQTMQIRNAA